MVYMVVKNGEIIIVTRSYRNAAHEYEGCIYKGKNNDIIALYNRKDGEENWSLAKKDWL